MSNRVTAALIPPMFRRQLLDNNWVYKAVVVANDPQMSILVVIYNNYIFSEGPAVDMSNPCLACISKILDIFKLILPDLIELEKESKLLEIV